MTDQLNSEYLRADTLEAALSVSEDMLPMLPIERRQRVAERATQVALEFAHRMTTGIVTDNAVEDLATIALAMTLIEIQAHEAAPIALEGVEAGLHLESAAR